MNLWAGKGYAFIRRSANVNLTEIDQNDLPRILLKNPQCPAHADNNRIRIEEVPKLVYTENM